MSLDGLTVRNRLAGEIVEASLRTNSVPRPAVSVARDKFGGSPAYQQCNPHNKFERHRCTFDTTRARADIAGNNPLDNPASRLYVFHPYEEILCDSERKELVCELMGK